MPHNPKVCGSSPVGGTIHQIKSTVVEAFASPVDIRKGVWYTKRPLKLDVYNVYLSHKPI